MVHALHEARRTLQEGGALIDLRPSARNRRVELDLGQARLFIGEIDSSRAASDYLAADQAAQALVAAGKLQAEHDERFEIITELDTVADLREFAAGLRRGVMPAAMPGRIEELAAGVDYRIRLRREMLIARYRWRRGRPGDAG